MGLRTSISRTALICAMVLLSGGLMVHADDQKPAEDNSELGLLKRTYHVLKIADHDYDGHRMKAMRSIEAACDILGENVRGDGKGGERQPVSDDQLRDAQKNLLQAHQMAMSLKQKDVVVHLDKAANELAHALGVK